MASMGDFDVEIQDIANSTPEHFNGTITTAGIPNSVIPTSGNPITSAIISNPDKGTLTNDKNDLLLVSFDSGTTYTTVKRGTSLSIQASFTEIKIDTNVDGTNYEVIITS